MTTFAVATPHALVLTVSHGLLFCQPPSFAAAPTPPFLLTDNLCYDCHPLSRRVVRAARSSKCISLVIGMYHRHVPSRVAHNRSRADVTNPQPCGSHRLFCRGVEHPRHARDYSTPMRALPIKLLGLNLAIPVCRPIRLSLSSYPPRLRCRPLGAMLRVFKATRHPHLGPIP